MAKRITIMQGHPDAQARHFCHALADEYAKGCEDGGHEIKRIEVAQLDFPLLRTKEEFEKGVPPDSIKQAQEAIGWADHLVHRLSPLARNHAGAAESIFRAGLSSGLCL